MRCADKDFGAERPLVTTGERLECPRLEDLLSLVDWKHMTEHQRLHCIERAPGPSKKSSKNCQSSNGSSSSSYLIDGGSVLR